jgi:isochorismate pyruvate lyase
MVAMPEPDGCDSLAEVRAEIDCIDEQIVRLLGRRAGYVQAAARFKTSEAAVAAPDRQRTMIAVRRQWAEREGLDPDVIEKLYRDLVAYFIRREMDHWKAQ